MPGLDLSNEQDPPPAIGAWDRGRQKPEPMTFGRAVRTCLRKYFDFSGRASRPEYWWFMLFLLLGSFAAGFVDALILGAEVWMLRSIFNLATLVPSFSAGWRRMHDSGRSGLHLVYPLIVMAGIATYGSIVMGIPEGRVQDASMIVLLFAGFVFLISPLLVLWWLTRPSDPKPNRYGPPPA